MMKLLYQPPRPARVGLFGSAGKLEPPPEYGKAPPASVSLLHFFPGSRPTTTVAGPSWVPSWLFVFPVTDVGGLPGPSRLGGIVDSTVWFFQKISVPMSTRLPRKLRVAGFQYSAPTPSSGAAIAVPPKLRS